MDFYQAHASSFSPVFSILKSLKNLKKTPSGRFPHLFVSMGTQLTFVLFLLVILKNKNKRETLSNDTPMYKI
jgi:hypothetical protein